MTTERTRVLIVDDESDLTRTLAQRFEAYEDFCVEIAFDGLSGLAKVSSFRPDIILVDVKMPGIGGWEFLRRIRGQEATRGIPVVVVTADQTCERLRESEERPGNGGVGAQHLVIKPFDANELVALVRRETEALRREGP